MVLCFYLSESLESRDISLNSDIGIQNDKSYPDINSLVLLSQVLDVTIDQLIKEDIEMMEEQINQDDIRKFGYLSNIFAVMMLITIITPIPLVHYL